MLQMLHSRPSKSSLQSSPSNSNNNTNNKSNNNISNNNSNSNLTPKTHPHLHKDPQRMKRRRGRQPRPSMLSAAVKEAIREFASHVGQPRVIEPAGFRDFRGWLAFINSQPALPLWGPIIDSVRSEARGDSRIIDTLKADVVREIVKIVVVPRVGESSKLVSTNCGRQCARPTNGVTLMTILDRLLVRQSDISTGLCGASPFDSQQHQQQHHHHSSTHHLLSHHGQHPIDHHKFMLHNHYLQQQQHHRNLLQTRKDQQQKNEPQFVSHSSIHSHQALRYSHTQQQQQPQHRSLSSMSDGILFNTSLRDMIQRKNNSDNHSSMSGPSTGTTTTTTASHSTATDHIPSSSLDSLLNDSSEAVTPTQKKHHTSNQTTSTDRLPKSTLTSAITLPSFRELENSLRPVSPSKREMSPRTAALRQHTKFSSTVLLLD